MRQETNEKCTKCGEAMVNLRYHASEFRCGYSSGPPASHQFTGEHLHVTCRNCEFEWPEKPHDMEEERWQISRT